MFSAHKRYFTALMGSTALLASICAPASAGVFNVKPIRLFLDKGTSSVILTIQNQDTSPLRIQVAGVDWSNDRNGQLQLKPTDDLIVFPTLLTMNPFEQRNIRIGFSGTPPHNTELSYRITIDELPSLESQLSKERSAGLQVRTRITVPVFLEPDTVIKKAEVESVSLQHGVAEATFTNDGNTHVTVGNVQIAGIGANGAKVFSQTMQGWYVLAGESRDFRTAIPKDQCSRVKALSISIQTDIGSFTRNVAVAAGECV
jgi:fimbrial chaperone protein